MKSEKIYRQYMYSYPHKSAYEAVDRLDLSAFRRAFVGRKMGLYVHIPFCRSKCGYCNLFSVTRMPTGGYGAYLDAVERHSRQMRREVDFSETTFSSFVLGGGTPLILSERELERLFMLAERDYRFDCEEGFSVVECAPTAVERGKLELLESFSVKRVSLGVQSFEEAELRTLERRESIAEVYRALEEIRRHSFPILNVDLIYGTPGQTEAHFLRSLGEAMRFEPEEIFLYPLYKQPNARLYHKFELDESLQHRLYEIGRDFLLERGYVQLSMRSFAKTPHLSPDCGFENTLSLGCGGRSYFDELHFCEKYEWDRETCEAEVRNYLQKTDFLKDLTCFYLDPDEMRRKIAVKNLLYVTGLSEEKYRRHFGTEVREDFPFLRELLAEGWVREEGGRLFLTEEGLGRSDAIGPMFISDRVRRRMQLE